MRTSLCRSLLTTAHVTPTTITTICAVPLVPCPLDIVWMGTSGRGTEWRDLMGAMGVLSVAGGEPTGTTIENAAEGDADSARQEVVIGVPGTEIPCSETEVMIVANAAMLNHGNIGVIGQVKEPHEGGAEEVPGGVSLGLPGALQGGGTAVAALRGARQSSSCDQGFTVLTSGLNQGQERATSLSSEWGRPRILGRLRRITGRAGVPSACRCHTEEHFAMRPRLVSSA